MSLSSLPSICAGLRPLMKSMVLAMRSFSSGMVVSLLEKVGMSMPESRPQALTAWSVAARTCRTSGNMSGASRVLSSTDGSTFLASAKAAALSSTAERLVRNCTKIGTEVLYIEMVMAGRLLVGDTLRETLTSFASGRKQRALDERGLGVLAQPGRAVEPHAGEAIVRLLGGHAREK